MNCTHWRYELSQCLDGRLPSGRRAQVMEHAAHCGDCDTFWNELQAAQRMVLQLPRERVGDGFRDQLWQRIQAGEGTPEAVFHEPVPIGTKIRYALTGAAAAAVVLVGALLLRPNGGTSRPAPSPEGEVADADGAVPHANDRRPLPQTFEVADQQQRFEEHPLFASTRRLTTDLVALEAARQLERRYATVRSTLDRLQKRVVDPTIAVEQVLDNADEFHSLGDLLLEMRDRGRLLFAQPEVEADLQVAVTLLGQTDALRRDPSAVTSVVGQAMQSRRLGTLSGQISLRPMDPREEHEVLLRLHHLWPEVFPKLFLVVGNVDELRNFGVPGGAFLMQDACGSSLVAPRSVLEARDLQLRWSSRVGDGGNQQVELQIVPSRRQK